MNKHLKELTEFCSHKSVSTTNIGIAETVKIVEQKLKDLGASTKVVEVSGSNPYILAELNAKNNAESKKTVLIYNHYDTQPAEPLDEWLSDPFEPEIRDEKFYARGVADNKGDLLLRLQSIRQMIEQDGDLPVNIKWLIEGEEELGSIHLEDLQKEYGAFWKDADVCIWEEGWVDMHNRPIVSLGMKGILYGELSCKYNDNDLHSKLAGVVDSPVWTLLSALKSMRADDGTVLIEGFNESVKPATDIEQDAMRNVRFDVKNQIVNGAAKKFLVNPDENTYEFLNRAYFAGTCNICGLWGGFTQEGGIKTIIPNKATAKLDFRLAFGQNPDEVENMVRAHLEKYGFKDVEFKTLIKLNPTKTALENKYVQACVEVFDKNYEDGHVVDITSLGGGPTYFVAAVYGIPVVRIGAGYPGSNMHAPNENVRVADYLKSIDVFADYLRLIEKI